MKNPLILLTGCINPNGMAFTLLQNPQIRKEQYINAIKYYLNTTSLPIVFTENSGTDISDEFKEEIAKGRLEIITYNGNNYDKNLGKGYGEILIIEHFINSSYLLKTSDFIFKISGRYILLNILSYLKEYQNDNHTDLIVDLKFQLTYSDSKFWGCKPSFLEDYLIKYKTVINDSAGFHFENALCKAVLEGIIDNYSHSLLKFCPRISGISGTKNQKEVDTWIIWYIKNIRHKLRYYLMEKPRVNLPKMPNPLVTIITSSFNAADTIEDTINSVLNQTYAHIEYIIIDGGSTDGTCDILKKYDGHITYWVSEPDNGIYNAWNKGLKVAKGQWIAFLGADDIYMNTAVEQYVNHIENDEQWDKLEFVSSKIEYVDKQLKRLKIIGEKWSWKKFSNYMSTMHSGMMHNKRLFEKYGNFDESYRSSGDYALLLKAGKNLNTSFLNEITVKMRQGGMSSNGLFIYKEDLRAKIESNNIPSLKAYFRYALASAMYHLRNILKR